MKPTDLMGSAEVQLVGNAVVMNGLSGMESVLQRPKNAEINRLDRSSFPSNLFLASYIFTAATMLWALLNFLQAGLLAPAASTLVFSGLVLGTIGSWFVTARSLSRFLDGADGAVTDARKERDEVTRERDLMRIIIDNLPDCIYAKDKDGRFVLNNYAHARHLGVRTPAEMLGKSDFDFFPKELATQFFADEQKIIETGAPVINQEQYKAVRVDGKETAEKRWSYTSKVLWRDPAGRVIGTAGVTRDIHEIKMIEQALRKSEEKLRHSSMQLERSNRELQDFAYVASHDLQEPLRKIVVFGERLKEKCSDGLSEEGQDYLSRMSKAAARMQVLISDLLAFSRITTKAQPFTAVDLSKAANDVIVDLDARVEQLHGRIEVGPLPIIQAEQVQMRQLLMNLISNSLKFRQPDEPPVVKIEAKIISAPRPRAAKGAAPEELCQVTIIDNGIGFEEKYLDRIFNVFQRLHTRGEYDGTGMGLAIVKKIVLYHGGEITATSKPGHGSTFVVTLPVSHSKDRLEVHHE
jgi:PAS domain S-box-containing protein